MSTILIDDLRKTKADTVCRTPAQAYMELSMGEWDLYIFDHDLGYTQPGTSGYDILNWALEKDRIYGSVKLVTSNPVGRSRMVAALEQHGFEFYAGLYRRTVEG